MKTNLDTTKTLLSEVSFSPLSIVKKHDHPTGFPFVIHMPRTLYEGLEPGIRAGLHRNGTKIEVKTPCFLKTDVEYVRLGLIYGDAATASKLWEIIYEKYPVMCYKNWL